MKVAVGFVCGRFVVFMIFVCLEESFLNRFLVHFFNLYNFFDFFEKNRGFCEKAVFDETVYCDYTLLL